MSSTETLLVASIHKDRDIENYAWPHFLSMHLPECLSHHLIFVKRRKQLNLLVRILDPLHLDECMADR
jgi:hypothetical protein